MGFFPGEEKIFFNGGGSRNPFTLGNYLDPNKRRAYGGGAIRYHRYRPHVGMVPDHTDVIRQIFSKLSPGETIKIITNSFGAAYSRGLIRELFDS